MADNRGDRDPAAFTRRGGGGGARAAGVTPVVLGDAIEGEAIGSRARDGRHRASGLAVHGQPASPPCVLISGGETTVTVRGHGRGGRNAEFLLALDAGARGAGPGIHAIACDTDGIDGTEDNAGALCAPDSLARAQALKGSTSGRGWPTMTGTACSPHSATWSITGPTRTNVNDFRAIMIQRPD